MNDTVEHSPGPWKVSLVDDTTVIDAERREVCTADGDYNDPDTWPIMEANARLIAAAPKLLKALTELTFMARTSGGTLGPDAGLMGACEQAEAAIAEAKGTPPPAESGADVRSREAASAPLTPDTDHV